MPHTLETGSSGVMRGALPFRSKTRIWYGPPTSSAV